MPIDASIYGLIRPVQPAPDPLESAGRALQIKGLMGQQGLQDMQRQKLTREFDRDERVGALFANGQTPTPEQVMAVDPSRGLQYGKSRLEATKLTGEIEGRKIENFAKAASAFRDVIASAQSDADMPRIREAAARLFGPDAAAKMTIPDRFDPAWQQQQVMTGDKLLERLKPHIQMVDAGGTVIPRETNPNAPGFSAEPIQKTPTPEQPGVAMNRELIPDGQGGYKVNQPLVEAKGRIAAAGAPRTTVEVKERQRTFENEDKLRADYSSNPTVKAAAELQNAFNLIESAYKRPSAANDLAMATKYMKILDPTSVVRESEFALAVNATGLLDKVQNYAAAVMEGKKLNPAQRKDFYDSAKAINDAAQAARGEVDSQFSEMAGGYGLNPKNVIPALRKPAAQPNGGAPAIIDFKDLPTGRGRR